MVRHLTWFEFIRVVKHKSGERNRSPAFVLSFRRLLTGNVACRRFS
jgi:hypothetical protein